MGVFLLSPLQQPMLVASAGYADFKASDDRLMMRKPPWV